MGITIIGADDWLVFARTDTGTLVFTVVETWPEWLGAPNGGDATYGSPEWQADWRYMMRLVDVRRDAVEWTPADTFGIAPDVSDEDFTRKTRARFGLPLTAMSLATALLDPALPVNTMLPVRAATIPTRIRRMVEGPGHGHIGRQWSEAWGPMPFDSDAPGCTFGCKVYVRRQGCTVRYAVHHSLTYGHSHSPNAR